MPICRVLACEAPQGSLPAFASGDVVNATDATGICSITEQHSLSPWPAVHTAVGSSCDVPSPYYGGAIWIYPVPLEWHDGLDPLCTPIVLFTHDGGIRSRRAHRMKSPAAY